MQQAAAQQRGQILSIFTKFYCSDVMGYFKGDHFIIQFFVKKNVCPVESSECLDRWKFEL